MTVNKKDSVISLGLLQRICREAQSWNTSIQITGTEGGWQVLYVHQADADTMRDILRHDGYSETVLDNIQSLDERANSLES